MRYVLLSLLLLSTPLKADPVGKPGDYIITDWACIDLDAIKMLGRSESVGQFNSRLLVFVGLKKCARFRMARLIAKEHVQTFVGEFGIGEIWTVRTDGGPEIYAILARKSQPS